MQILAACETADSMLERKVIFLLNSSALENRILTILKIVSSIVKFILPNPVYKKEVGNEY